MIKNILFDLDGTLTDAAPGILASVRHALAHVPPDGRVVFAGSSLGALVSGLASLRRECAGLFLMALPLAIPGYDFRFDAARVPLVLVHGWDDELCPVEPVIAFARERAAALHLFADGHRLAASVADCAALFAHFLRGLG